MSIAQNVEYTQEELAQIGKREIDKKKVAAEKAKIQFEKNKSVTYANKRLRTSGSRLTSVVKRFIDCVKVHREEVRKANARNSKIAGARKMKPKDTVMEEFILKRALIQLHDLGKQVEVADFDSASSDLEEGEMEEGAPAQDIVHEASGSHDSARV